MDEGAAYPGNTDLQNRQGVATRRLDGSIPSPLRGSVVGLVGVSTSWRAATKVGQSAQPARRPHPSPRSPRLRHRQARRATEDPDRPIHLSRRARPRPILRIRQHRPTRPRLGRAPWYATSTPALRRADHVSQRPRSARRWRDEVLAGICGRAGLGSRGLPPGSAESL